MDILLVTNGYFGEQSELLSDPTDLKRLQNLLEHHGVKTVDYVDEYRPENMYLSYHEMSDLPNVWTLKRGYIPDHYYLDPKGYSGWSTVPYAADPHSRGYPEPQISHSKYKQEGEFKHDDSFLFVPLQMRDDEVSRLSWTNTSELAYQLALKTSWDVVVKPHPGSPAQNIMGCTMTNASIHSIIPQAKAVITVNSGVGFEALLMGKPVFVAGDSDYARVCYKLMSFNNLSDDLINGVVDNWRQPESFLSWMLNDYYLNLHNIEEKLYELREWHKKIQIGYIS